MIATPALVTREAAIRLPRVALWAVTALYLLPGLFGRDPWRNAELTAYGVMLAMAEGRSGWLHPTLAGLELGASLPAHWLGAISILLLTPLGLDAPLASRLPFTGLLGLNLTLIWYACYRLARTEAAQPVAFAFGGEAAPQDYARSLADGAVLAFMATLGVLQLGHETTPEIVQLTAVSLLLWSLATPAQRGWKAGATGLGALVLLSAAGAPALAVALGAAAWVVCRRSSDPALRPMQPWVGAGMAVAALTASALATWRLQVDFPDEPLEVMQALRLLAWFTWPTAPLAAITIWRWRRQGMRRHVAVPLLLATICTLHCLVVGASDRALLLAIPGIAVLAAFALPTLSRSGSAAVDWFSVFFFSGLALVVWVIHLSLQTGWPAPPARNAAAVAPDYRAVFDPLMLAIGLAGTLAWIWLVRWRTARHRQALWKSLVLPACGVLLNWLLAMTLLLHPLDYTRSLTPWIAVLREPVGNPNCIAAPGMPVAYAAALEAQGRWVVDARSDSAEASRCEVLMLTEARDGTVPEAPGWIFQARIRRPTERYFAAHLFRREPAAPVPPENAR